jgi:hypothetical protein
MKTPLFLFTFALTANATWWTDTKRSIGDWCEKRLIATDYTEQLDFYEWGKLLDFDRWAQDEYLKTARVLYFRFDRDKRAYLRQLGDRMRRRGTFDGTALEYEHLEDRK